MPRKYNPLLDGENFDEIDLGDNGGSDTDRLIDRVTMGDMEFAELFGPECSGDMSMMMLDDEKSLPG